MERRTALTAASAAAFSVLAIGAAITTNLRPDDAKASTSSELPASTTTTVSDPRIVTIVVPAPDAPNAPASASPVAAQPATVPGSVANGLADDHGRDAADELADEDRHELDERELEHEAEHHEEVEHEVEDD